MSDKNIDKLLDHEADGIQEFDNALPKWWLYGFYFTIVFSIVYMIYYHTSGGPLSGDEYKAEVELAKATYKTSSVDMSAMNPLTDAIGLEEGRKIFEGTNNACFTCHRADLGGQVGPNLTDEFWLHGGSFSDIVNSITTGFQDKGMLPYGTGAKLNQSQLMQVASYIWSKRGINPPEPKAIDPDRDKKYDASGLLVH